MNTMSNLNASLTNMSRNELENEIVNLKHINAAQSEKIDNYEQEIYVLKRQVSTARAMEEHFTSEIESLQRTDKSDNNELLKKISAFEDEIQSLKQTYAENVQFYELQVQNKDVEIKNMIEDSKSKLDVTVHTNNDEINKYTDEICDLKLRIEELEQQLLNCENKYQEISLRNNSLENHITELTSQLNEVKDCLQSKREELEESKELARNLQDDMIIMQMEIDKFKSLPMETASKGNSLFAEVDDNRVKLQRTLESMKKKYLDMKTQYTSKCQELQKLHMEYAALIKVIEDKNDSSHEKSELKQIYERHFERLNENIKSLENELVVQKHTCTKLVAKDWKCVQEMISVSRQEVQTLQRKLNAESLGLLTSESNHYKTKRELKRWQAETMQLRAQIVFLNQTLDDLKLLKSPPAATYQESDILKKSCLKNKPVAPLTKIDDWDVKEEKSTDYSLLNPKLNDTNRVEDLNSSASTIASNADYSIFDLISVTSDEINLMDDLNPTKVEDKVTNKENTSQENIISDTTLNNMSFLTSKMRKVSFEDTTVETEKTNKLGGRLIIKAKPVHIPSIKRN